MTDRRDTILAAVETAVANLLYYDRKEDEDLPRGEIEAAVAAGELASGEIVDAFRDALHRGGVHTNEPTPDPGDTARAIVRAILDDMTDRRGFRQNWDAIDPDIQSEIEATWCRIAAEHVPLRPAPEPGNPTGLDVMHVHAVGSGVGFVEDPEDEPTPGIVRGRHIATTYRVELQDGQTLRLRGEDLDPRPDVTESTLAPRRPTATPCRECAAWDPPEGAARVKGFCRRQSPPAGTVGDTAWPRTGHNDWCTEAVAGLFAPQTVDISVETDPLHNHLNVLVNGIVVGYVIGTWGADDGPPGTLRGWEGMLSDELLSIEALTAAGERLLIQDPPSLVDAVITILTSAADVDAGEYTTKAG